MKEKIEEKKLKLKTMIANKLTSENLVFTISQRTISPSFVTPKVFNIASRKINKKT